MVDHGLLLKKFELYRASDSALSWFTSYLSDCFQFVALDGQSSARLVVKHGVPQGLLLGPILFLLFVNDLPLHLQNSSVDIFTGDTTLSLNAHYSDLNNLTYDLNSDLDSLNEWSAQNKMFINVKKTKSRLVTGRRIPSKVNDSGEDLSFQLKMGGVDINSVKSHKLSPGVTLDKEMSYECHVEELSKKLSKRLGLLKHISPYLKQAQREMYFNSIVKPILMYGIMIWDKCSNSCKQLILRLQKRAVRIILI